MGETLRPISRPTAVPSCRGPIRDSASSEGMPRLPTRVTARAARSWGQDATTNPSIATYGWLLIESTLIVSVCLPTVPKERLKRTARATKDERHMSTFAMARPSSRTSAEPRVGPAGPTHLTDEPVKVNVAVEPGVFDQATLPPM